MKATAKQHQFIESLCKQVSWPAAKKISMDLFGFDCTLPTNMPNRGGTRPGFYISLNRKQAGQFIDALKKARYG